MNWRINFYDGIQTTFEWILIAVVAIVIITTIVAIVIMQKHQKRKVEYEKLYGKFIEDKRSKTQPQSAQDRWSKQENLDQNYQDRLANPRKFGHPKRFKISSPA
jgi:hypothetical protein